MDLEKFIQSKVEVDKLIQQQLKKEPCISFDKANKAFYVTVQFRGRNIVRKRFKSLEDAFKVRAEGLVTIKELSKQLDANNDTKEEYIGNIVKVLRMAKGLSRQELGNLVSVRPQTIRKIEMNEYPPTLLVACAIAEVFERKIEDIFIFDSKNKYASY